jgi:hypothetical protein
MALTAYFGVLATPTRSEPLAYIYGEWVVSFLLLAYAGLLLPISAETLQYATLSSRPTSGLQGE